MRKIIKLAIFVFMFIGMQLVNENVALAETIYCPDTEEVYNSDGELIYTEKYTYNKYGEVVKSEIHWSSGGSTLIQYKYNRNGQITHENKRLRNGNIEMKKNKYSNGMLKSEYYYLNGKPYKKYTYDQKGNFYKYYSYDKKNKKWRLENKSCNTYYKDGKLKTSFNGELGDVTYSTFKYDSFGRLLEEKIEAHYWDSVVYKTIKHTYTDNIKGSYKDRIVYDECTKDYGVISSDEPVISKKKYACVEYYDNNYNLVRDCYQEKVDGKWKTIMVEKTKYKYYKDKYIKSKVDTSGCKTVYSGFKEYNSR